MKPIRILFLTIGDSQVASSRARVYYYIPYLKDKGIKTTVFNYTSRVQCKKKLMMAKETLIEKISGKFHSLRVLFLVFLLAPFYSRVYIQKVCLSRPALALLKIMNRRVIFDLDDAVYLYKDISYIFKWVESVIVSNDKLKKAALKYNDKVSILISPVHVLKDIPLHDNKDKVIMGWLGSPETSRYLIALLPVFRSLLERFKNLEIILMGAREDTRLNSLGITMPSWSVEGEKELLAKMDMGIMPLERDEYSSAKGGYKLLMYMSYALPSIASPVGVNKDILVEGVTGFFADSKEEWLEKASALIKDKDLRSRMGASGWMRARSYYSYEAMLPKFLEAIK